jgi:hypothetical protein
VHAVIMACVYPGLRQWPPSARVTSYANCHLYTNNALAQHDHVLHHHYLYLQPHWGWLAPRLPDQGQEKDDILSNVGEAAARSQGGDAGERGGRGTCAGDVVVGGATTTPPPPPPTTSLTSDPRRLGALGSQAQIFSRQEAEAEDKDIREHVHEDVGEDRETTTLLVAR